MGWLDALGRWAYHQVWVRSPELYRWLEDHFHAVGLHGPTVRHLARTRLMPATLLVLAIVVAMLATVAVQRVQRRRSRARRAR